MSKIQQDFVVKTVVTDPATICPAAGYRLDPLAPSSGWVLLATFQTNSGAGVTFDPTLTVTSGQYAWDLGDGSIMVNDTSISHYYAGSTTKTVKLYRKDNFSITQLAIDADNLVGALDLSNLIFSANNVIISASNNALLTSLVLPASLSGSTISSIILQTGNLTGVLDLSMITKVSAFAQIAVTGHPLMTGVTFANTITGTGTLGNLYLFSNNLSGILNLSQFTSWSTSANIAVGTNPNVTGVIFANTITGTFNSVQVNSCNLTGTLDLSMFTSFGVAGALYAYSNPNLTGITFANTVTGTLSQIQAYSCNLTGNLDLSMFTSWTTAFRSNPNLTGITFASTITGTFNQIQANTCNLTGTLDLSMFTSWVSSSSLILYSNPNLTGITFANAITGTFRQVYLYNCSLGYVDFSKLSSAVNSVDWQFQNNGWSAAVVNQVLRDINSTAVQGTFTGRVILINGTNATPDATSGGCNGIAERNGLIAKGFTVTTSIVLATLAATDAASAIATTTATSGGNVLTDGTSNITARGVCWRTTSGPTIANSKTSNGTGLGSFTSSMTGLTANTTYYVRAYATNSAGTAYGAEISFTTLP